MREALEAEGVGVERGVELVGVTQDEGGVRATLRRQDGGTEEVEADYLIGADGAHSSVRKGLGLGFEGKTLPSGYDLWDVRLEGDLATTDFHVFASGEGVLVFFPLGGDRFRVIASQAGDTGPGPGPTSGPVQTKEPSLDDCRAVVGRRSHLALTMHDLSWSSSFHVNSRMVGGLRSGRVFLGGDAAHVHSPAGGQGMNTGIQDMINLCWKLALVSEGRARGPLLETYGEDRLPVIRGVLRGTEALTGVMGSANPLVRAALDHIAPWVVGTDFVQDRATAQMSQVALNYRTSPLSGGQARGGRLHPGDRVPDLDLPGGGSGGGAKSLFSTLSPSRFTLLAVADNDPEALAAQAAEAVRPWGDLIRVVPVAAAGDGAAERLAQVGRLPALLLVRPDGYIGYLGGGDLLHLAEYCGTWLTTPNGPPAG